MQATVTMSTKLGRRTSARSGPANPHMPGLRRRETTHAGASALVSRPQEGQRMAPVVLRNIVVRTRGNAVALVEPLAEIDQPRGQRAERSLSVAMPRGLRPAGRTGHLATHRASVVRLRRCRFLTRRSRSRLMHHRDGSYRRPTKPVNSHTLHAVES